MHMRSEVAIPLYFQVCSTQLYNLQHTNEYYEKHFCCFYEITNNSHDSQLHESHHPNQILYSEENYFGKESHVLQLTKRTSQAKAKSNSKESSLLW